VGAAVPAGDGVRAADGHSRSSDAARDSGEGMRAQAFIPSLYFSAMHFGIPEWALGVGFIVAAISIAKAIGGAIGGPRLPRGRNASRRELAQSLDELQGKVGGIEDLQRRLAELEDVQHRLADVEERLDFAERMLARQRDSERLVPPKQ